MGRTHLATALAALAVISLAAPRSSAASVFADGFSTTTVITGLDAPVAVRFAPDGSAFVAEKVGLVKRFDPLPPGGGPSGPGRVVLDLRSEVGSYADRGLLGLALDPAFPLAPYVYVLYTRDAPPGQATPHWNDTCGAAGQPDPGAWGGGCVASGRLVRFTLAGDQVIGSTILVADAWYQQFSSHSVGDLAFGPDGMLYASAGEGSNWESQNDIGDPTQISTLDPNPDDPIGEGGALRAQDALTPGDPLGYSGSVIRVDPASPTETPALVAFGLRNPYRMTFRPGTRELWLGDVGSFRAEEIDRIADVTDAVIENFGWPCHEAERPTPYGSRPLCTLLASHLPGTPGTLTAPRFSYLHGHAPNAEELAEPCYAGPMSALTGVAFYSGARYPTRFRGALVIADYELGCMWALPADAEGTPDPARLESLVRGIAAITDVASGPDGDLFIVTITGAIHRLHYTPPPPPHDPNGSPASSLVAAAEPDEGDAATDHGGCAAGPDGALVLVILVPWRADRRRRRRASKA